MKQHMATLTGKQESCTPRAAGTGVPELMRVKGPAMHKAQVSFSSYDPNSINFHEATQNPGDEQRKAMDV